MCVVIAFRRAQAPNDHATIKLRGVPDGASVEVKNLDTGVTGTMSGELEIRLPNRRSSTVMLYSVKRK